MNLKRGSVLGVVLFSLASIGTAEVQAQGVPVRLAALQTQLDQAMASIAQLQAALAREAAAREAAVSALDKSISALKWEGVSQAALEAAIASEASARSAAVAGLHGQIDSEAAARAAFDATMGPLASLAAYVGVDTSTINDLAGPHVIFTGVNVHIRSGHRSANSYTENGLGTLVLCYIEPSYSAFLTVRGVTYSTDIEQNTRLHTNYRSL